jgi:hypothetical protein
LDWMLVYLEWWNGGVPAQSEADTWVEVVRNSSIACDWGYWSAGYGYVARV